jgi:uracil-DNA glycosylase family 4
MASGLASRVDPEDLRTQLCNWLRLLEHSGMEEIVLAGGAEGLVDATRLLIGCSARPLAGLAAEVAGCKLCDLHRGRTNTVFGEGNLTARLMFVGEGPGADEDAQGRPFVGRAGVLLTKIIEAMGLAREEVYIGNIVKCRPPGNRVPDPDEIASCLPYLEKQIEAIGPEIICTLGNVATQTVTGERRPISEMRGKTYVYRATRVIPTYHPAACLRNPDCKKLVWEDIKIVMKHLNLPIRGVTRNGAGTDRN